MRVLFTTNEAVGHLHPLVPIARALEARGHPVAFASLPSFASTVEASGFRFFPVGPHRRERVRVGLELPEATRSPIGLYSVVSKLADLDVEPFVN